MDDDRDDAHERDAPDGGFGAPLPPDDRLWRHPSELGPAGAAAPVTIVTAPRGSLALVAVAAVAGLAGIGGTLAVLTVTGALDASPIPTAVETVQIEAPKNPNASDLSLADQVIPAVVTVEGAGPTTVTSGAGVVFRTDGYVLTTSDAVDGAFVVDVTLHDGRAATASVVGVDRESDLAVLKVEPGAVGAEELPAATIGRPAALELGERTIAVWPRPGTEPEASTVSVGLVSGLDQRVDDDGGGLHDMIETSVRLEPEVTGAPLIDNSGAVIGIVTRRGLDPDQAERAMKDGDTLVSRFATPVDWAKWVADQLIVSGRVAHVWLGVEGKDIGDDGIERLGRGAAAVVQVNAGSPAAEAGLAPGDLVIGVDDAPVTSMSELIVALRRHQPGETVSLRYLRDGEDQVTLATLQERNA
jgi:S1-C subfamily serine protease